MILVIEGIMQSQEIRREVETLARKYGVKSYIENRKPYDVRIVCEGDERNVDQFTSALRTEKVYLHRGQIVRTFRSSKI